MKPVRRKCTSNVTAELLQGFSPFLASVGFDFEADTITFRLVDDPERVVRVRRLSFHRVRELRVTALAREEQVMDSVIGVQQEGERYFFQTERFEIEFQCDSLVANEEDA